MRTSLKVPVIFLSLISLFVLPMRASAQGSKIAFTLAPPPLGFPVSEKPVEGQKLLYHKLGIGFASIKTDAVDITGFSPTYTMNRVISETSSILFSTSFGVLKGNKFDLSGVQIPLKLTYSYRVFNSGANTATLFGGSGAEVLYTTTKVGSTKTEANLVTVPINLGIQYNRDIGDFIVTPYVTMSQNLNWTSIYINSSTPIEYDNSWNKGKSFVTTVVGFDALYKPLNMSLSGLVQSSKDSDVIFFTLSKILKSGGS